MRVLMLSWEYPPLIEGGLARHVRKLSENLACSGRGGARAHARTRGVAVRGGRGRRAPAPGARAAATGRADRVHRLGRAHEHRHAGRRRGAGRPVRLRPRPRPRLARGRSPATTSPSASARRSWSTIHATEYGRHQGWVDKHPQSHIHGIERWMANRAEQVIACSAYMRDHICRHLRDRGGAASR